jgi:hypothetical protein
MVAQDRDAASIQQRQPATGFVIFDDSGLQELYREYIDGDNV